VERNGGEQRSGIGAEPAEEALLDFVKLTGGQRPELAKKKLSGK